MESRPLTLEQVPPTITSWDQVPTALNFLIGEVNHLRTELAQRATHQPETDRWFSIEELSEYLPGKPAITTLYGKVQRREIPFSRQGKTLSFLKSEIDAWLKSARVKTSVELASTAEQHTSRSRRGGRKVA